MLPQQTGQQQVPMFTMEQIQMLQRQFMPQQFGTNVAPTNTPTATAMPFVMFNPFFAMTNMAAAAAATNTVPQAPIPATTTTPMIAMTPQLQALQMQAKQAQQQKQQEEQMQQQKRQQEEQQRLLQQQQQQLQQKQAQMISAPAQYLNVAANGSNNNSTNTNNNLDVSQWLHLLQPTPIHPGFNAVAPSQQQQQRQQLQEPTTMIASQVEPVARDNNEIGESTFLDWKNMWDDENTTNEDYMDVNKAPEVGKRRFSLVRAAFHTAEDFWHCSFPFDSQNLDALLVQTGSAGASSFGGSNHDSIAENDDDIMRVASEPPASTPTENNDWLPAPTTLAEMRAKSLRRYQSCPDDSMDATPEPISDIKTSYQASTIPAAPANALTPTLNPAATAAHMQQAMSLSEQLRQFQMQMETQSQQKLLQRQQQQQQQQQHQPIMNPTTQVQPQQHLPQVSLQQQQMLNAQLQASIQRPDSRMSNASSCKQDDRSVMSTGSSSHHQMQSVLTKNGQKHTSMLLPTTVMPPTVMTSVLPETGDGALKNAGRYKKKLGNKSRKIESPQQVLERILSMRGYIKSGSPVTSLRISSENTCYDTSPSPLQLASFGTEVVRAIHNSDTETLGKLLSCGLSANPCNQFRDSIVDLVCKRANNEVFQCLMEHGCELRVCDGFGRTPLHHCCWASEFSPSIVDTILRVDPQQLFMEDKRGQTPLEYVRPDQADLWIEYLEDNAERLFPRGGSLPPAVSLKEVRKDGHLPDPSNALPIQLASAIASGQMTPEDLAQMSPEARAQYL
jgi:hypothetical protein